MGDYAPATATIWHVPPANAEAVESLFTDYEFAADDTEHTGGVVSHTWYEVSLGFCDELGARLDELGVSYSVFQDPKYEYTGWARLRVFDPAAPGGSFFFEGPADADGNITVTARQVDLIIAEAARREDPLFIARALNDLTGKTVRDAIDSIRPARPDERGEGGPAIIEG